MTTKTPTLAMLRAEARRVFGEETRVGEIRSWPSTVFIVVRITSERELTVTSHRSGAARRFAYETLRAMPSKEISHG